MKGILWIMLISKKNIDLNFVAKQLSWYANDDFHELMAEWFASSKESELGQFISNFVKGMMV